MKTELKNAARFGAEQKSQGESPVSIEEIVHTCSHEKVAQAAVASLGHVFATRVRTEAESQGVTTGAFAARLVHEFGKTADAAERRAIKRVMDKADQPILYGLRYILEGYLRSAQSDSLGHGRPSATQWSLGPLSCDRWSDFAERRVG